MYAELVNLQISKSTATKILVSNVAVSSTLFNSGSLAKFPKILPEWACGEYEQGEQDYWSIATAPKH